MKADEIKLLELLTNHNVTFFIPPYQRNYEWTNEQCDVFYEDVLKTSKANVDGNNTEHFFGSITFFKSKDFNYKSNKYVLIDGQQRVTTTMLFLCALRDILGDDPEAESIDAEFLKNKNAADESEYKIKLKQVEADWGAYKNIILGEELSEEEKKSAVWNNYSNFRRKLQKDMDVGIDLHAILNEGLSRFSVIIIELEPDKNSWENPQEIFESLNSLGKPLSLADLVRNYLMLGLAPDTQDKLYKQYWMKIEKFIPSRISDFVRDYMQAVERSSLKKSTANNSKELYAKFKEIFRESDSQILLKDMSEYAPVYSWILQRGSGGDHSCGNKKIDRKIQDLNRLNATTIYSFLLVLLHSWNKKEFSDEHVVEILDALRIYLLRRRLLALSAAENKFFPHLVKDVERLKEAPNKKSKMFEILANQEYNLRMPDDSEIHRYLKTMNFYNFSYCKFYLSLIEEKITKQFPDQNNERLQIEHIMPRTLNKAWKEDLGDDFETIHSELVNTIGNLTLISHNQELGNKEFSEKKKTYNSQEGFQIARKMIIDEDVWRREQIEKREEWIVSFLLEEVLPLPPAMRKANNYSQEKKKNGLSFEKLNLIGKEITFFDDPSIRARVLDDKHVEFEGEKYRLSPLTKEIQTRKGRVNQSGSYQGSIWWRFNGVILKEMMEQVK